MSSSVSRAKRLPGGVRSAQTLGLMGRQIEIAMDLEDEKHFLEFLRTSAEINVYRSWSPTPTTVGSLSNETSASMFWLHNAAFPWEPKFERVDYNDKVSGEPGTYYRLETRHAPLLEYSRHPLHAASPQAGGRLYWSKLFVSQPSQIAYDLSSFDTWYTSVVRWVRRHGKRVNHGSTSPWCLPGARLRLTNEP